MAITMITMALSVALSLVHIANSDYSANSLIGTQSLIWIHGRKQYEFEVVEGHGILPMLRLRGGGLGSREVKTKAVKKKPVSNKSEGGEPKASDGLSRAQRKAKKDAGKNQKQQPQENSKGRGTNRSGGLEEAESILHKLEQQKAASKKAGGHTGGAFSTMRRMMQGSDKSEQDEDASEDEEQEEPEGSDAEEDSSSQDTTGGRMQIPTDVREQPGKFPAIKVDQASFNTNRGGPAAHEVQTGDRIDVKQVLEDCSLCQYADAFAREEITTIDTLSELGDEDLKELGLKMGERKTLLKYLRTLPSIKKPSSGQANNESPAVPKCVNPSSAQQTSHSLQQKDKTKKTMDSDEDVQPLQRSQANNKKDKKLNAFEPSLAQAQENSKVSEDCTTEVPDADEIIDRPDEGQRASAVDQHHVTKSMPAQSQKPKNKARNKGNKNKKAEGTQRAADELLASLDRLNLEQQHDQDEGDEGNIASQGGDNLADIKAHDVGGRGDDGGREPDNSGAQGPAQNHGAKEQAEAAGQPKKKLTARERKELKETERAAQVNQQSLSEDKLRAFSLSQATKEVEGGTESLSNDVIVEGFSISVGGKVLFKDADLRIAYGQRYGLVGPNGQGKTTLLMHVARKLLAVPKHIDILLVEQETSADDTPAIQMVLGADTKRSSLLDEQRRLEEAITHSYNEVDAARLQVVYGELDSMGAAAAEAKARTILFGLGFPLSWQDRPTRSFSGGWRMRIALARALFMEPTLLLLDEPTNHLDLNAVLWLDSYLSKWKKTLMVVSHDVDFLNSVCTDIVHVEAQQLNYYRGSYDKYVDQHASKVLEQGKAWDKQQKALKALKASGKSNKQADDTISRKQMREGKDKAGGNKEAAALADARGMLRRPKEYEVRFSFPDPPQLSPPILQMNEVAFTYTNGPKVFNCVDLGIWMDSRIAIVGPNGCGKSTLLNLLTGDLEPSSGEVRRNPRLRIGRYNQHFVDQLPLEQSAVQYLQALALAHNDVPMQQAQNCRKQLGRYGLEAHAHLIKIKDLSGGQKARVAFAGMAVQCPHILMLDEPTNHLDIESIEALSSALSSFQGGIVLVSHDARLIKTLHQHEKGQLLLVEGGSATVFEGGMEAYHERVLAEMHAMEEKALDAGVKVRLRTTAGAES